MYVSPSYSDAYLYRIDGIHEGEHGMDLRLSGVRRDGTGQRGPRSGFVINGVRWEGTRWACGLRIDPDRPHWQHYVRAYGDSLRIWDPVEAEKVWIGTDPDPR